MSDYLAVPVDTLEVLKDVGRERKRQDDKWGSQRHLPNGTSNCQGSQEIRDFYRGICDDNAWAGEGNWLDILREEAYEAFAEEDPAKLRKELIQVAAVAVAWAEAIDR